MKRVTFAAVVGVVTSIVARLRSRRARARVRDRQFVREALTTDQFAWRLFRGRRVGIAGRLRELLAAHTQHDLSRLRPEDRLQANLEMETAQHGSVLRFLRDVDRTFGVSLDDRLFDRDPSFRDIVDSISRSAKGQSVAPNATPPRPTG